MQQPSGQSRRSSRRSRARSLPRPRRSARRQAAGPARWRPPRPRFAPALGAEGKKGARKADGKIVFFQDSGKFNYRYSTLGFVDAANLDDGALWPVSYALQKWTAVVERKGRRAGEGCGLVTAAATAARGAALLTARTTPL